MIGKALALTVAAFAAGIVSGGAVTFDLVIPDDSWPSFSAPDYWPIIYIDNPGETFSLPSSGRGTLIIRGNFTISGAKTWNGLAPYLGTGVGVAIGEGDEDIGGYKFGAKLFLAPMIGTRYFLSDRLFLRAEARAILWKLTYPDSYQQPWPLDDVDADPEDAVLPGGPESEWVMSPTLSFGLGYSFRL